MTRSEVRASPAGELCFRSRKERLQVRIGGKMEEISEPELLEHIVETRFTFLKPVVKAHGWEMLTLFRLSRGEVRIWAAGKPAGVSGEDGGTSRGESKGHQEVILTGSGLSVLGGPVVLNALQWEGVARSGCGG